MSLKKKNFLFIKINKTKKIYWAARLPKWPLKKPKEIDNTQVPAKSRLFKQKNALKITEEPHINYNNSLSLFEPTPKKIEEGKQGL